MARRHELSVRVAVGASRWRLVRQHLTESVTLAALSAVLGVMIAAFCGPFSYISYPRRPTSCSSTCPLEGRVLLFTVVVTTLTALLFGTAPAFRATRVQPIDALREGAIDDTGAQWLMGSLVAVQVALSVVLIVAAGLFIRSFAALATRELGFQADPVLVVTSIGNRRASEPARRPALYDEIRAAVRRLPNMPAPRCRSNTGRRGRVHTSDRDCVSDRCHSRPSQWRRLRKPHLSRMVCHVRDTPDCRTGFHRRRSEGGAQGWHCQRNLRAQIFGSSSPIGRNVIVYPNTPRAQRMEIVGLAADAVYSSPRDRYRRAGM